MCTGEPPTTRPRPATCSDYPRVYGGTLWRPGPRRCAVGLSPCVRGNRRGHPLAGAQRRTIPVCTGEPAPAGPPSRPPRDYPRVYGGTGFTPNVPAPSTGLSPCVRGNRLCVRHNCYAYRTIPVCTGEPARRAGAQCPGWDYPRVYGGTPVSAIQVDTQQGLSPCVRGNQRIPLPTGSGFGTIPVCTGEPQASWALATSTRDYPRVYGGTPYVGHDVRFLDGLSPCVRGNRERSPNARGWRRTIPVCTGEPHGVVLRWWVGWDYPRVYGGTPSRIEIKWIM